LQHTTSAIENYLYTLVQESIKESSLGARIEKISPVG